MALTQAELEERVKARLRPKVRGEVVWGDVVSSVASAPLPVRDVVIDAIKSGDQEALALALQALIFPRIEAKVSSEAAEIVADSSMTLDEIERVFLS